MKGIFRVNMQKNHKTLSYIKENKSTFYVVFFIFLIIILIPLFIDHFIIANQIQSNLSNSEWFSFLSSYIGGVFGGGATLIAIWITYNQTHKMYQGQEKANKATQRLAIMPFLQIEVEGVNSKKDAQNRFVIDNANNVLRAVVLTENKVDHVGNELVYPYRISNSKNIMAFLMDYIDKDFLEMGEVGIVVKEVCITNIGMQSAIIVNCYINNNCVWKFNLGKEQEYRFLLAISSEMIQKRVDIAVVFRDLYNNEYIQQTFYEAQIETIHSIIPPEKMRIESFQQSMTTAPLLKESE